MGDRMFFYSKWIFFLFVFTWWSTAAQTLLIYRTNENAGYFEFCEPARESSRRIFDSKRRCGEFRITKEKLSIQLIGKGHRGYWPSTRLPKIPKFNGKTYLKESGLLWVFVAPSYFRLDKYWKTRTSPVLTLPCCYFPKRTGFLQGRTR